MEIEVDDCNHCEKRLSDAGGTTQIRVYVHESTPSRDVRWVLTLHGMNTRGSWQEQFNWLVSKTYRYAIPVAIYKYGIVRPGAFLKFRQRQLVNQVIGRMRRLITQEPKRK